MYLEPEDIAGKELEIGLVVLVDEWSELDHFDDLLDPDVFWLDSVAVEICLFSDPLDHSSASPKSNRIYLFCKMGCHCGAVSAGQKFHDHVIKLTSVSEVLHFPAKEAPRLGTVEGSCFLSKLMSLPLI